MSNYEKIKLCKQDFFYFTYFLEEGKDESVNYYSFTSLYGNFFNENNLQNIFSFYGKLYEDKVFIVEEIEKNIGFSTFCMFWVYYICFANISNVLIVMDSKMIKHAIKQVIGFVSSFKDFIKMEAKYIEVKKIIEFDNGSKITFYSDITYDFRNAHGVADLLIFDNAVMKNFDKLTTTVELLINHFVAKKAVINFNLMPPLWIGSENFEYLKKEFKKHIDFIKL